MADLIDKQSTLLDLRALPVDLDAKTVQRCIEVVSNKKTAQPVRQTAEWIYGEKDGADGWYCSKCGFHVPWYYDYYGLKNINFIRDFHTCPHCDAKMVKYTGMDGEQA